MAKKAVVLLSGGLDSSTCLYWALARGCKCFGLCVHYGQRHSRELKSARAIAKAAGIPLHIVRLRLPWLAESSLVDKHKQLPNVPLSRIGAGAAPSTYVPGRNLVFVSLGVSWADAVGADAVILGPNALDYSGYPDCRPEFYSALSGAVRAGTKRGAARGGIKIITPIIKLSKSAIVKLAVKLSVPLARTWSCYKGGRRPCGKCDSCKLRLKGFADAGFGDPLIRP